MSTSLKNNASILDKWGKSEFFGGRKHMRNASQEYLEKALLPWFQDPRSRIFQMIGPLQQMKDDKLANQMDTEDFKWSDG